MFLFLGAGFTNSNSLPKTNVAPENISKIKGDSELGNPQFLVSFAVSFREGTSHLSMDWFGPARREVLLDETLLDAALSPSGKMQALDALAEIKRLTMQLGLG